MGKEIEFRQVCVELLEKRSYRITVFALQMLVAVLNLKVLKSSISYKDKILFINALIVLAITSYTDLRDRVVPIYMLSI